MKHNYTLFKQIKTPLLLALFLLWMNGNAWGAWPTYSGTCNTAGYVLVANDETYSALVPYSREYNLSGPGATLTFKAHRTIASVGANIKVYQYVNGSWESNPIFTKADPGKAITKSKWGVTITTGYTYEDAAFSVNISPLATKLKFYFEGTLNKYLQNICVTRCSSNAYALYDNNLDCGSADYNYAQNASNYTTGTAYVDWSHIATQPTCTITGSNAKYFEIGTKSNTPAVNQYGAMGIVVKYKHTAPGDHSATLRVGNKTITIKGHTNAIPTYIATAPTVNAVTYGDVLSNNMINAGVAKADVIGAAGTVVAGTWSMTEAGQTVTTSGGSYMTVGLTFTPSNTTTYASLTTTAQVYVRSASNITWANAYSADKPTIIVGKTIEGAATTTAAGEATVKYTSSNNSIIEISEDGTSFKAVAEGEATITASHGVTANWGDASVSKTFKTTSKKIQVIVWNNRYDRLKTDMSTKDLNAQVYVEDALTGARSYSETRQAYLTYESGNNNVVSVAGSTLTIKGAGTTTLTARVPGNDEYEETEICMPVVVREPSTGCDDPLLVDKETNGTNDYLLEFFQMNKNEIVSDEYAINRTDGRKPDKLSFSHKGEYYKPLGSFISSWTYYAGSIKAQQKVNGSWVDVTGSSVTPTISTWKSTTGLQLDDNATAIRFVRPKDGEGHHYIKNVEVTQKEYISASVTSVDFGSSIKVNSSEYRDITINYSNVKDVLRITKSSADLTINDQIDVDCGAHGSATLRLTYAPTTAGDLDDYIYINDQVANKTCTIHVQAKAQRADQTITWNPITEILATESIVLNGTTNGVENGVHNAITYTSDDPTVVEISNGVATIKKAGTVNIVASQAGSTNYAKAADVKKSFTINAETLTLTAPAASNITYGDALSASKLSGGSAVDSKGNDVEGTYAWQSGSDKPNSGDAQDYTVVFTPKNHAAWYATATAAVSVNVAKATSDATPSAEGITAGNAASSSTLSNSGTTAGTWAWTDERKDDNLTIGEYDLDVQFTPNDPNYTTINTTAHLVVTYAQVESEAGEWGDGEETPTENDNVVLNGNVTVTGNVSVAGLTVKVSDTLTIASGGSLTVGDEDSQLLENYGHIIVEAGGKLTLGEGEVRINEFTLYSSYNGENPLSAQITGQENIKLNENGKAHLVLDLVPSGTTTKGQWYTFTVPFPVDEQTGISRCKADGTWEPLADRTNYYVMEYDENQRAQTGNGWKWFTGVMQPGVGYMITTENANSTYRFTMAENIGAFSSNLSQPLAFSSEGATTDRGWNFVGNGSMANIALNNSPAQVVQMYNPEDNTYTPVDTTILSLAVGAAYFVQATSSDPLEMRNDDSQTRTLRRAPQRVNTTEVNRISLGMQYAGKSQDLVIITCDDESEATYTIGKDVQKLGATEGAKKARLWVDAKDTKLCVYNKAYTGNETIIPLSIYVPKAGDYTLALNNSPSEDVYLRRDGVIIWNMAMGDYTDNLAAGTDYSYELVVIRRAPSVATGVNENIEASEKSGTIFVDKFIDGGKLFLLREGVLYDARGCVISNR